MTHRTILTARQRSNLFDLPRDQAALLRHYVLGDHDVAAVRRRKGDANQLGFALQNLVWNESSTTTILYLPSLIKTVSEAERLLTCSYRSEFESIGCCHWHVREW